MYFGVVAVVFLFAYGIAVQSLLYPNSEETLWRILFSVFYRPYLSVFEQFDLGELEGKLEGVYCVSCPDTNYCDQTLQLKHIRL